MNAPAAADRAVSTAPVLHLDGFDGPMDLLLELARAQKVDLARISIGALVEQYLAVVAEARAVRLELAADWLVMAAWLTWLKSRLLLPEEPDAAEEVGEASALLAARLLALELMRSRAAWLAARPLLGRDVHARGLPETLLRLDRSGLRLDLPGLLRAWVAVLRRQAAERRYVPPTPARWTVGDALARLAAMLGRATAWIGFETVLPRAAPGRDGNAEECLSEGRERSAAVAATLLAGLELARDGAAELRQEQPFGPILLRRRGEAAER